MKRNLSAQITCAKGSSQLRCFRLLLSLLERDRPWLVMPGATQDTTRCPEFNMKTSLESAPRLARRRLKAGLAEWAATRPSGMPVHGEGSLRAAAASAARESIDTTHPRGPMLLAPRAPDTARGLGTAMASPRVGMGQGIPRSTRFVQLIKTANTPGEYQECQK